MKFFKIALVLVALIAAITCNTEGKKYKGIKVAINEDIIAEFLRNYFPTLMNTLKSFKVPDTEIPSYATLKNIKLDLDSISDKNVAIVLKEDKNIGLEIKNVKINGSVDLQGIGFIYQMLYDTADITVESVDISANFIAGMQDHPTLKKKKVPKFTFEDSAFKLAIKFDFKLRGTVFNAILSYFKDSLKTLINDQIDQYFKKDGLNLIKDSVKSLQKYLVGEVDVGYNFIVNYCLLGDPKVVKINEKNTLIMNLEGILNLNSSRLKQEFDFERGSKDLENFQPKSNIGVLMSDASINSMLSAIYNSGSFLYEFPIDNIYTGLPDKLPEESNFFKKLWFKIKNAFNPLEKMRENLENAFQENKNGLVTIALINKAPKIAFNDGSLEGTAYTFFSLSGFKNDEGNKNAKPKPQNFLTVGLDIDFKVKFEYKDDAFKFELEELAVNKYKNINSSVHKFFKKEETMQVLIDMALSLFKKTIASAISNVPYKIPDIYGFKFDNTNIALESGGLKIESNISFVQKLRRLAKGMNKNAKTLKKLK